MSQVALQMRAVGHCHAKQGHRGAPGVEWRDRGILGDEDVSNIWLLPASCWHAYLTLALDLTLKIWENYFVLCVGLLLPIPREQILRVCTCWMCSNSNNTCHFHKRDVANNNWWCVADAHNSTCGTTRVPIFVLWDAWPESVGFDQTETYSSNSLCQACCVSSSMCPGPPKGDKVHEAHSDGSPIWAFTERFRLQVSKCLTRQCGKGAEWVWKFRPALSSIAGRSLYWHRNE